MKLHNFQPELIYKSIIRETSISKKNATVITNETVRMLIYIYRNEKFTKHPITGNITKIEGIINYLSGPFIRSLVRIKMLEHGFEVEELEYARVGIPKFDLEQIISEKSEENLNGEVINRILTERNNINILIKNINNGSNKKV